MAHGMEGLEAAVRTGFGTLPELPEAGDEAHDIPCPNGPDTLCTLHCKMEMGKHYTDSREVNC